jgi:hypothetical protein
MTAWLALAGAGVVAFALRAAIPLGHARWRIPDTVAEWCRLGAVAAVAAPLAGSLVESPGEITAATLAAPAVAAVTAGVTRSLPIALGAGLLLHIAAGVLP